MCWQLAGLVGIAAAAPPPHRPPPEVPSPIAQQLARRRPAAAPAAAAAAAVRPVKPKMARAPAPAIIALLPARSRQM